jgi:hypothetical protein
LIGRGPVRPLPGSTPLLPSTVITSPTGDLVHQQSRPGASKSIVSPPQPATQGLPSAGDQRRGADATVGRENALRCDQTVDVIRARLSERGSRPAAVRTSRLSASKPHDRKRPGEATRPFATTS